MSKTLDFPGVQPGVISALLFIFLDIFTVALLDIVLARVVCFAYYRNINIGEPVSVDSADVPGISNYLIGGISWINLIAIATKLLLLGVVLTANISIDSKQASTQFIQRSSTFRLSPSDEHIQKNYIYTVKRRLESSKSCFRFDDEDVGNDGRITYYSIRFNLREGFELSHDYGSKEDNNRTGQYDVNDSTLICMSPSSVSSPDALIKVIGCTRTLTNQSCHTIVSFQNRKDVTGIPFDESENYTGQLKHKYRTYSQDNVNKMFSEYKQYNPKFTCLSTEIGISSFNENLAYTHCLLVVFNTSNPNEVSTIVERWVLGPDEDGGLDRNFFVMEYPGLRFEGIFNIGKLASARYLELPFPFADHRTLSGELVAQASDYEYIGNTSLRNFGQLEVKENFTVTTINIYAVAMVAVSVVVVLVSLLITSLLLRTDKRPRFNTINGLSSIVREEHVPSGRSYSIGANAMLGLSFTQDDRLHFGPLRNVDDAQPFFEEHEIS